LRVGLYQRPAKTVALQRTCSCWKVHSEKGGKSSQALFNMLGRWQEPRSARLRNEGEGISIPFAHKWLRFTLEQAAETPGEPLFGASNGPTGDPTPVTLPSNPKELAALKAELEQKLLQIRMFEGRARQDSNLRPSDS